MINPSYDQGGRADAGQARRAVIIGESRDDVRDALEAVELAGGRIHARLDWAQVERELADHSLSSVVLVETAGASPEQLDAALPRIDMFARTADAAVLVALHEAQIDQVAGDLLGDRVQLLCRPTIAERVGAFALANAGRSGVALEDAGVEGERLRRLNEEVARIADTLARLTRRDPPPPRTAPSSQIVGDRSLGFAAQPAVAVTIEPGEVRQAIRARRLRDQFFGAGLFEDPAWDMLLDLFAAHLEHARVSVSSLCIAAAVAPTTALRWIGKMIDAGLLVRQPDAMDRRRAFMVLSPTSLAGMEGYVGAARRQGLPIA